MNDTMHEVYLHGGLGEKYTTDPITVFARDLPDVINGLACRFGRGFKTEILSGAWHVGIGKPEVTGEPSEGDRLLSDSTVGSDIADEEVHIYPRLEGELAAIASIAGALGAGAGVAGAAGSIATLGGLITAGGTASTLIGAALTLAGTTALSAVIQAISSPKMDYDNAEVDRNASLLYNGVVNVVEQGGAVPLWYGKCMGGSTVISAAMVSEEMGQAGEELALPTVNFEMADIGEWEEDGATIIKGGGAVAVTKTTGSGTQGAAVVNLSASLQAGIEYTAMVAYTPKVQSETSAGHNKIRRTYVPVYMEVLDGATVLASGSKELSHVVYFTSTPFPTMVFKLFFTMLTTPVTPNIRVYEDPNAAIGSEMTLQSITVEKRYA